MKKLFVCLMAILIGISFTASAQSNHAKMKAKEAKKMYKKKVNEYKKDGFKIFGSTYTLEYALLDHYEALEKDGVSQISSSAKSTNKTIGRERLQMSACSTYAESVGSQISGRITEDMGQTLTPEELSDFDHFYAAFESNVKAEIKGALRPSFMVYREIKEQGKTAYEFEAYFLIDEAGASQARIRAFKNALKESSMAQKYAEKISEFINEVEFVQED